MAVDNVGWHTENGAFTEFERFTGHIVLNA